MLCFTVLYLHITVLLFNPGLWLGYFYNYNQGGGGMGLLRTLIFVITAAVFTPAQAASDLHVYTGDGVLLDGATIEKGARVYVPVEIKWAITLRWNRNDKADDLVGYKVFLTINDAAASQIQTVAELPPPSDVPPHIDTLVKFSDAGINVYDKTCYNLKAYNVVGESGYSDPACVVIDPIVYIDFYLDDVLVNRVESAPWDFKPGQLTPGEHKIKALINLGGVGDEATRVASFTVKQPAPSIPTGLTIRIKPL